MYILSTYSQNVKDPTYADVIVNSPFGVHYLSFSLQCTILIDKRNQRGMMEAQFDIVVL